MPLQGGLGLPLLEERVDARRAPRRARHLVLEAPGLADALAEKRVEMLEEGLLVSGLHLVARDDEDAIVHRVRGVARGHPPAATREGSYCGVRAGSAHGSDAGGPRDGGIVRWKPGYAAYQARR
eukprot:CAMPEP_0206003838 /NCGR_PEP_ID=MMETSP1464-20131121/3618_1 /ASSEMBLY_ACC=CAM_ASM_001124 /TAXON_ID=119497 /ORGANISM="Exanthemachrysis gayraliae, Strain RCC1523" /LENGTH=123 /DNA_ID=CAMNT_0053377227 /DNA_START=303 /DNA_END=670 /DNA_ORIENTATION=+